MKFAWRERLCGYHSRAMQSTDAFSNAAESPCELCGEPLGGRRRDARFCSESCRKKSEKKRYRSAAMPPRPPCVREQKSCIECGTVFRPANRRGPTPKCCSEACQHAREYRSQKSKARPVFDVACVTCGASFTARSRRARFCSGQCQSIASGRRISLNCDHCGMGFTRNRDAIKGVDNNFCSRQCHHGFTQKNATRSRQADCEQCGKGFASKEKNGHWDRCCSMECSKLRRGDSKTEKATLSGLVDWFFQWHYHQPCERFCESCGIAFWTLRGASAIKCSHRCGEEKQCDLCGKDFYPEDFRRRFPETCRACVEALRGIVADAKARKMAVRNAWILSGYKPCQRCAGDIPVKCFGDTNRIFCSSCKGFMQRERWKSSPKRKRKHKSKNDSPMRAAYDQWISSGSKPCSRCQSGFPVSTFQDCNRLYCQACTGDIAREKSALKAKKKGLHRKRARNFNVPYENVDRLSVFQRDEYKCWICGKKTLSDFAYSEGSGCPHPDSPTLDHVIPLSRGGPHSYSNTRCACFLCNCQKGDKIGFVKCQDRHAPHTGGQC